MHSVYPIQFASTPSVGQPVINAPNAHTCICQQHGYPHHNCGHQVVVLPLSMQNPPEIRLDPRHCELQTMVNTSTINQSDKVWKNVTSEAGSNEEGVKSTKSQQEADESEASLLELLDEFPMVLPLSFVQKIPGSNPIPL